MSKAKVFLPVFTLMLCLGVLLFPLTAFAQTGEDTTAPTVTATLSGDTLTVVAKDNASGIAAIYVNEHCFATLVNGTANIQIKGYAGSDKQIAVYATDTAGNRSTSVLIDNPYYQAPTSTPAPTTSPSTTTPAPTTTPSSTSTPTTTTPTPSATDSSSSDDTTSEGEGTDGTDGAISEGDTVVTPEGTGQVTEIATDEDGKLFYTIQTPAGNVFYLVIDMARVDGNNVYFLNAVTEDDLLALAETDGSTTGGVSAIPDTDPEPTPTPKPESADPDPETEGESAEKGGGSTGAIIFVILAALAVGGAAYYFKILKPKQQAAMQDEDEYEDEEFEEGLGDDDEYLFADELGEYEDDSPNTEE